MPSGELKAECFPAVCQSCKCLTLCAPQPCKHQFIVKKVPQRIEATEASTKVEMLGYFLARCQVNSGDNLTEVVGAAVVLCQLKSASTCFHATFILHTFIPMPEWKGLIFELVQREKGGNMPQSKLG